MIVPTLEAKRFQCPLTQKPCTSVDCMAWHNLPPLVIERKGNHHTQTAFDGEKPLLSRGFCGSFGHSKYDHDCLDMQIDSAKFYPATGEREEVA